MKKIFLMMLAVMSIGVFTSCSKEDDEIEVVETVSGAEVVLKGMQIKDCIYFERAGYCFSDVTQSGEPNSIALSVYNDHDGDKEGCTISCSIVQNYRTTYTFNKQFCEKGHIIISDTGRRDSRGNEIRKANVYIPKMYDTNGNVVKDLRLSYEGNIRSNGMLEY